ncbi:MAG: amino acid permease [Coriobacteriia bacterium]|nr:amino acid permease [Coriobacteriia bacterium]
MARKTSTGKKLTMLAFYALTVAMVMDLHEYPLFATSGLSLVFFLVVGGVLWFLPASLCSAEMATVEDWEAGGVYVWVKNTLGELWGFAAIFFQWLQVTVGFIAMLYFILGAISSVIGVPALNTNPLLKCAGVVILFWIITLIQFGGSRITERIGDIGSVVGIIIPTVILLTLTVWYLVSGGHSQVAFSTHALIPNFTKPATLVVFISFILSYMGVEASASYANDLDNPKRNYPLAMILVVISAIALNTIGGMAVALTVPISHLSLNNGIVQALVALFAHAGVYAHWAANLVALMIAVGVTAEVAGWVIGPARGIYMAAQQGLLPPVLRKANRHDVPVVLVLVQGVIVTIWAIVLTIFGGGGTNLSFQIAISLTVVIYAVTYFLLFAGYFKLLFKQRDLKRRYQIPGGVVGKTVVAGIGLLATLAAFGITFVPPSTLSSGQSTSYLVILIAGFFVCLVIPFVLYALHDKSAHTSIVEPKHLLVSEVRRLARPLCRGEHGIHPAPEDYLSAPSSGQAKK